MIIVIVIIIIIVGINKKIGTYTCTQIHKYTRIKGKSTTNQEILT